MQQEYQPSSTQTVASINVPERDFIVMRIRLETDDYIKNVVEGLLGGYIYNTEENGQVKQTFVNTGKRIVNFIGASAIQQILKFHINPHTVQGNFHTHNKVSQKYEIMLEKFQVHLGNTIVINKYTWDFDMYNFEWFMMSLRDSVEMFLSRCLDNKERDSYSSHKSVETSNNLTKSSIFGR